jgi:hypothetical protein
MWQKFVDTPQQPQFFLGFAESHLDGCDCAAAMQLCMLASKPTKMTTRQLSLSYEELAHAGRDELKRLVEADLLDEPTRARCVYLARFFEKVSQMAGPMEVSDSRRRPIGRGIAENLAGNDGAGGVAG